MLSCCAGVRPSLAMQTRPSKKEAADEFKKHVIYFGVVIAAMKLTEWGITMYLNRQGGGRVKALK